MDLDKRIETVKQNSGSSIKKYGKWVLIAIVGLWAITGYNGLINAEEPVNKASGNIEAEYQARVDKVKVISKIVKSAANYEYTTLVDVVKASCPITTLFPVAIIFAIALCPIAIFLTPPAVFASIA